ncbi:DUF2267 domain-containing protein [Streptomyces sp. Pv4-95]|uniref:DUF2267 domain-containing protein n=1 Tax=Streptomyces sp. Pv4-95 TaxID=3049543 RepID=UPI003891A959
MVEADDAQDGAGKIRYEGAYYPHPGTGRGRHTCRAGGLGRQHISDARVDLAGCLPTEAALVFAGQIPDTQQLTGWGFVKDLATRTDTTPATARWDTGAVLAVVGHLAGSGLLDRVLAQLPPGYALLFGRAELTPRRSAAWIQSPFTQRSAKGPWPEKVDRGGGRQVRLRIFRPIYQHRLGARSDSAARDSSSAARLAASPPHPRQRGPAINVAPAVLAHGGGSRFAQNRGNVDAPDCPPRQEPVLGRRRSGPCPLVRCWRLREGAQRSSCLPP